MSARVSAEDLLLLNETLRGAVSVGAPLPEGLEILARDLGRGRTRGRVEALAADLRGGMSLSEALARQAGAFPPVYVRLVRAGEQAGNLEAVLLRVGTFGRELGRLRLSLREALVYPALLYVATLAVAGLVLGRLLPGILGGFSLAGQGDLPGSLGASLWIADHAAWAVAALALLALPVILPAFGRGILPGGRPAVCCESWLMRLPLAGGLLRAMAASRFCHSAALLVERGIPAPEAIVLAADASGSAWMAAQAPLARQMSERGAPFSDALAALHALPPVALWISRHGERRRELPAALEQLAQLYLDAALRRQRILNLQIPMFLILALGALVLLTSVCLFLPLIQLLDWFAI